MLRTDDWSEDLHPRGPDGKFGEGAGGGAAPAADKAAQRVGRAASVVARSAARVAKVAAKVTQAKAAKKTAVTEARGALKDARKHATAARKDPTIANLRKAVTAAKVATRAQAAVETHAAAIVKHTTAAAEAKTNHALAVATHKEAARAAAPRRAAAKAVRVNPRGVGFERVHGEHETGAQELEPTPEHAFAIGETRIRGVTEQPELASEPKPPAPAPPKETVLGMLERTRPNYVHAPVAAPPAAAHEPGARAADLERERRAEKRARSLPRRRLAEIPGVAAVLPSAHVLANVPGVSAVSLPAPHRDDDEERAADAPDQD